MKINEKGFGLVVVLIFLIAVLIIGGVGWYVWRTQINDGNATKTTQSEQSLVSNITQSNETTDNKVHGKYISIMEWGIKIGIGPNEDKVIVSEPSNIGTDKSEIAITVKKEFDIYEDCQSRIIIQRLKDVSDFDIPPKNKVGEYYYYNSGVGECGGAKESENTNTLSQNELLKQFTELGVESL